MSEQNTEREAFEEFVKGKFFDTTMDEHGYTCWTTQMAWKIWRDTRAAAAQPCLMVASQSAEPVALTQALQDIGYEFGCPVGIKITDWLRLRLAQPKVAIAAIRKVKESLDPDDWCGDESMIDALERAESAIAIPPAATGAQGSSDE